MAPTMDSQSAFGTPPTQGIRSAGAFPASRKRLGFLIPLLLICISLFSIASEQSPGQKIVPDGAGAGGGGKALPYAVAVARYIPANLPKYQGTDLPTPTETETATPTETETSTPSETETPAPTETETPTPTETPATTTSPEATQTPTETETPTATLTPTETETPTLTPTATRDVGIAEAPSNDDIENATAITGLPFSESILTDEATTAGIDPDVECANGGPGQQSKSVWYSFAAAKYQALTIDTQTSDYDTVIAIWRGPTNGLIAVACSEDPTLTVSLAAGTTYYIEIVQSGEGPGGTLNLSVDAGAFQGLRADYYNNLDFSGSPALTRIDPGIAFDWGGDSPAPEVNAAGFSVRWSGRVFPEFSEVYTFYTYTDDGVRLWVDGQLIIDHWTLQEATEWSGQIALQGGEPYSIVMEYFQGAEYSIASLEWSSDSVARDYLPAERLDYLDMENSVFEADGTQPMADGNETSTLTVTLLDQDSDPVAGVPVYLRSSGTGNLINGYAAPADTWVYIGDSDAFGQAAGHLASIFAGTKTVEAMAGGITIGSPVQVAFINGSLRRVNISHATGQEGSQANNQSSSPSISDDGNLLVFLSGADNLVDGDTNGITDIFIFDEQANSLSMAVFAASGGQPDDLVLEPEISANGQYIAFTSLATNLDTACTAGNAEIFVYQIVDGAPGVFTCVSIGLGGVQADGISNRPSISSDGRFVAFTSTATNLVAGVADGNKHIYLYDRDNPSTIELIDTDSDENPGNSHSDNPVISADGRYVAFESISDNLLGSGQDLNGCSDIFLRDRQNGTTIRVSVSYDSEQEPNADSTTPSISNDGTRVVFLSEADNLIPDISGATNVFLRDIPSETTLLVSISTIGGGANGDSYSAEISPDGERVIFSSSATNLVSGYSGGIPQIYLRTLGAAETFKLSMNAGGEEGNANTVYGGISSDGTRVIMLSEASNLVAGDSNGYADVFLLERTVVPQAPPNDDIDFATEIGALPFSTIENTDWATTAIDDPASACSEGEPSQHANSVWFSFQPSSNVQVALSTIGSDYDTVLAVWTGSRGALIELTCNDDSGGGMQSELEFAAIAGTQYWIEVVQRDVEGGGELVFSAEQTSAPPVVVTVSDTDLNPEVGLTVQVYNGNTYTGYSGTTNQYGQASIILPEGEYRFRVEKNGTSFWSGIENHCAIPGCSAASITTTIPVVVTVLDTNGTPEVGMNVLAYTDSTFTGYTASTNAQGQATFTLPVGSYRFRTAKGGTAFWSGADNHCTVPGCTEAGITTTVPVTVTVLDLSGQPAPDLYVYPFDGTTFTNRSGRTNAQGQATFTLPLGSYRFRADQGGKEFWSGPTNHCTLPGCTSVDITVNNSVLVTVRDTSGSLEAGLNVMAYSGTSFMGIIAMTDTEGQATLYLPAGNFHFRVVKNGASFWSGNENHCAIPGCTSAEIVTTLPVTVTVLDLNNQPAPDLYVYAFDGTTFTNRSARTNAQGQVTFTLPQGSYRFRADKGGYEFWSGPVNHCTIPGCSNTVISVNNSVVVIVRDSSGSLEPGMNVLAYSGSTFIGITAITNAQGQATLPLPAGDFHFRVAKNGTAFWSGTENHCTVPECTSAEITTSIPITVTILDLNNQPAPNLYVYAFDGTTFTNRSALTNAQGQALFTLPQGSYRFRADQGGKEFWSGPANHCAVPGCTTVGITVNNPIIVTVHDSGGTLEPGMNVMAYSGSTFVGFSATTDALGQATLHLPAGAYRFRVAKNGMSFWSGIENHCSVPGCNSAEISTSIPITVTVLDLNNQPAPDLYVYAFDGTTFTNRSARTNAQGQVTFTLSQGSYRFRADKGGYEFWSGPINHCTVPGCSTASITVDNSVIVTVHDSGGTLEPGMNVMAYSGSTFIGITAITNAQGQATLPLPAGDFHFRVAKNGTSFWSGTENHCTIPECTSAEITTSIPIVISVLTTNGLPESDLYVYAFDGTTFTNRSARTNDQGQAVFTLPQGTYRFRADKASNEFWSGPVNHCPVPGCTAGTIITGEGNLLTVSAGLYWTTCGVTNLGDLMCWGANYNGQIGDGTQQDRYVPTSVFGLGSTVQAVDTAFGHTCALTTEGGVKCWGSNYAGELGNGTTEPSYSPVDVTGLASGVTKIVTGYRFTCALTEGGGVKCWGLNIEGQMGDGTCMGYSTVPFDVPGLSSGVIALSAGLDHACAVLGDGTMKCWGANLYGQIGDGTYENNRCSPVDVVGLGADAVDVSLGFYYSCALTTAGGVKCWGLNTTGCLGNGTDENSLTPSDVIGLSSGVFLISAGEGNTCALTAGGGLKCWGSNTYDQLRSGIGSYSNVPVDRLEYPSGLLFLSVGSQDICVITGAHMLNCWGYNWYGEIGNGTRTPVTYPFPVYLY
ncbi:MAG: Ig-like domain-containing protein [Anaerolineales bacterium]|nr:Ig-like domain-containing protein [Anaerolineales bacterium]